MSAASILQLREALRARFPTSQPLAAPHGVLPTGVAALDAILPSGGVPRGRLSEWVVARGGGSATLLRALVHETVQAGHAVAIVDAQRTLAAADWVPFAESPQVCFVRPSDPADAPFCAELLLRTGVFALVVLDGIGVGAQQGARLAHRAEETGCALLLLRPEGGPWLGAGQSAAVLRLHLAPQRSARAPRPRVVPGATGACTALPQRPSRSVSRPHGHAARPQAGTDAREPLALPAQHRAISATLVKGGPHAEVTIPCVYPETNRLCAHPRVPDRRGAARRGRTW